jgi:hypothetical protein
MTIAMIAASSNPMRHILRTGLAIALSAGLFLADGAVEAQVPSAAQRGYMNIDDSIGPAGESRDAPGLTQFGCGRVLSMVRTGDTHAADR